MEYDFQILIINQKLDIEEYMQSFTLPSTSEVYHEYLSDMRIKLEKENISETYYYIIVTLVDGMNKELVQLKSVLLKLEKIGLKVKMVDQKTKYLEILYELINKEKLKRRDYE